MACHAVIDTNVLVSSLLSSHDDAATVLVVEKLFSGEVILVYSNEIINEYKEVLLCTKFHFTNEIVNNLLQTIEKYGEQVEPTPIGELILDMKDLPFYEVVVEKQTDNAYLVTGNKKLFSIKPFRQTYRLVKPLQIIVCHIHQIRKLINNCL